jgi:hypothetical protein
MLKEIRNSRMLKSKSEVAACNDFASWLIKLQKDNFTDKKIVLVFFEPLHSKILQLLRQQVTTKIVTRELVRFSNVSIENRCMI